MSRSKVILFKSYCPDAQTNTQPTHYCLYLYLSLCHVLCIILYCLTRRSLSIKRKRYWNRPVAYPICRSVCLSVGLSNWKVYCGKTADWIRMPFGMVNGVGREVSVLDGVVIIKKEGAVLVMIVEHSIVTSGDFAA